MRNKDLFERKLDRFEAELKNIGYLIRRNELTEAFNLVGVLLEKLEDLQTLLRTEKQD